MSLAGAFDLEVADGSLRVNRREARSNSAAIRGLALDMILREVACAFVSRRGRRRGGCGSYQPTFDEASVKLFKVVDLPDDGFPTKPIRGSRGIL